MHPVKKIKLTRGKNLAATTKKPAWASIATPCSDKVKQLFYNGANALRPPHRLCPYQVTAVVRMLEMETREEGPLGGIQADDMGLGKSFMAMFVIKANPCGPTLIVCEVSALDQWRRFLLDFLNTKPVVLQSGGGMSDHVIADEVEVVLTTYSLFQKAYGVSKKRKVPMTSTSKEGGCKYVPPCLRREWGRIMLDEAHKIRNRDTAVHEAMCGLKTRIRWALTATPIQNSQNDVIALGTWLGLPEDTQFDEIRSEYIIRRTMEEVAASCREINLIPLVSKVVILPFNYMDEVRTYDALVEAFERTKSTRSNKSIMALQQKILHTCISPTLVHNLGFDSVKKKKDDSTDEDDDDNVLFTDIRRQCDPAEKCIPESKSTKIDYILDYVQRNPTKKFVVFCKWLPAMDLLQERFTKANIHTECFDGRVDKNVRGDIIYNFQETPQIRGLIIQINCGATGLNLQKASIVFNCSPDFNPCTEAQAVARVWRRGQIDQVIYIRLVIKDTIEEDCLNRTQEFKLKLIEDLLQDPTMANRLGSEKKQKLVIKDEDEDPTIMKTRMWDCYSKRKERREAAEAAAARAEEAERVIQAAKLAGAAADAEVLAQAVRVIEASKDASGAQVIDDGLVEAPEMTDEVAELNVKEEDDEDAAGGRGGSQEADDEDAAGGGGGSQEADDEDAAGGGGGGSQEADDEDAAGGGGGSQEAEDEDAAGGGGGSQEAEDEDATGGGGSQGGSQEADDDEATRQAKRTKRVTFADDSGGLPLNKYGMPQTP
ncbi:hypothetical protein TSOC_012067 [Tetrabaena socialis]|uniref:Uncharacterized protein n=1 Tax=Tetrabaena socialis TaxID=47790 RepID=A0A2J7ZNZ9_9CHLO|nr:hypothetical protein TSOC_012067 [Tetrabaena socialis]|eukprot:PNH01993.1 hypothetical protein TSOC_012067 [Tetrabaena socialis]